MKKVDHMQEAEDQYKLALEADPNDVATHYNYGNLLKNMGRMEEAEDQYKLALEADPKNVSALSNYGILLYKIGRLEEAEDQYKLALEIDPNDAATLSNYGILLKNMGHLEEAEDQYKLALEADPNNAATHHNYGNLLKNMGRLEEAEDQYKLALEADPKNVSALSNYGLLLDDMGRFGEAENHYKLALETDPNDEITYSNYGNLLYRTDRLEEAEEQYKIAIKLDPKYPNSYGAYGLLLLHMNLEEKALEKTKIASRLFRENGDEIKEHLALAWFYEELARKYYGSKNYPKSGNYAELSGNEYIEAGNHAGEKLKSTSLTKGYTLKGRAKIRKLEIKTSFYKRAIKGIFQKRVSYDVEAFTNIIDCIADASKCYKKAAEASPEKDQICNACSTSMLCLSDMLNYMLAVIKQEKTPQLEDKLKKWDEKLAIAKNAYKENSKGELFIESLYKLEACIQNLDKYKKHGTREYGRAFEECRKELSEIANNI